MCNQTNYFFLSISRCRFLYEKSHISVTNTNNIAYDLSLVQKLDKKWSQAITFELFAVSPGEVSFMQTREARSNANSIKLENAGKRVTVRRERAWSFEPFQLDATLRVAIQRRLTTPKHIYGWGRFRGRVFLRTRDEGGPLIRHNVFVSRQWPANTRNPVGVYLSPLLFPPGSASSLRDPPDRRSPFRSFFSSVLYTFLFAFPRRFVAIFLPPTGQTLSPVKLGSR